MQATRILSRSRCPDGSWPSAGWTCLTRSFGSDNDHSLRVTTSTARRVHLPFGGDLNARQSAFKPVSLQATASIEASSKAATSRDAKPTRLDHEGSFFSYLPTEEDRSRTIAQDSPKAKNKGSLRFESAPEPGVRQAVALSPELSDVSNVVPRASSHKSSNSAQRLPTSAGTHHTQSTARIHPTRISLAERLFPTQHSINDVAPKPKNREAPRLKPLPSPLQQSEPVSHGSSPTSKHSGSKTGLEHRPDLDRSTGSSPVLRIEAVSKSLTIADFRRIIPQGKHIEGWSLEQGDIVDVIAGRQLDTLAAQTSYFLLFASPESARTYWEHVHTIHQIARAYTPDALHSATQLLPPGMMASGMDIASVVQAYTLLAPGSRLFLRQLNFPLSSWTKLFLRHETLPWVQQRPDRDPFELRLTFDGPETSITELGRIFFQSGQDRGLPWSGGSNYELNINEWKPVKGRGGRWVASNAEEEPTNDDVAFTPRVYIVGFSTEHAARSFRAYWHKRPLRELEADGRQDLPPTLNLDHLW